ncbi:type IV pilus biogenesis protein PilM [Priestia abyssalis]|uniref:type IV pilus biogenesis protein PilM n=1 Tax=Priestia abyssalis TaxID=1221450 RepID=UPI00195B1539|nr:pilus assembly protein PilM [Priestia abyssalis]
MVLRLPSMKGKIGNLVIKDHVIRYAELKHAPSLAVSKAYERYLPKGIIENGKIVDSETLSMILDECVLDWGLKRTKVRFVVPDDRVVIRHQTLPESLDDDEIKGYLYMEIGSSIHLPFEDAIFDFFVTSRTEQQTDIILFAAPEELVLHYSEVLQEAKLQPVAADVSPLCLYRLCHHEDLMARDTHQMFIQIDLLSVNVSVFHEHQPTFMRHIPLEDKLENWNVTNDGNHSVLERVDGKDILLGKLNDIYKEVERIVNFYKFSMHEGKTEISQLFVTGDHPYLMELFEKLQENVSLPAQIIDVSVQQKELPNEVDRRYYLALGLALKEVQ